MRKLLLFLLLLCFILPSCAQHSGGGDYLYEKYDPATGAKIKVGVHSARRYDFISVNFKPTGEVSVNATRVKPGPNNVGELVSLLNRLVELGASAATTGATGGVL